MSFDTYANLQTEIADWLNRADLTSAIPGFIALAEARFNRELRTLDQEERYTAEVDTDYFSLPANWLDTIELNNYAYTENNGEMVFVAKAEYNKLRSSGITGNTRYYTTVGRKLLILPAPTSAIELELVYHRTIPALSGSNPSNWLLASHPDIYLFGSLVMADAYLVNDERLPIWANAATGAIKAANESSDRARQPRGSVQSRRRTFG